MLPDLGILDERARALELLEGAFDALPDRSNRKHLPGRGGRAARDVTEPCAGVATGAG
ncbi:MAG: hypothetical protein U1A78_38215 [Polyangia bacterium]